MVETLTGWQRLRAFITRKADRITELETEIEGLKASAETWQELDTANTNRVAELEEMVCPQGKAAR